MSHDCQSEPTPPQEEVPGPISVGAEWLRFREEARKLGAVLDDGQLNRLAGFEALLRDWNRKLNLTAIADAEEIREKHFLDSLAVIAHHDFSQVRSVLDVGTGAGIPGLVLKIALPHIELVLLDSVNKKLLFAARAAFELGLEKVHVCHARAEDASAIAPVGPVPRVPGIERMREHFDVVVCRAVARLNVLSEWTLPFARVGGHVLAMKGPSPYEEIEEARGGVRALGGGATKVTEFALPHSGAGRSVVIIGKLRPCPRHLPRRPGSARAKPL